MYRICFFLLLLPLLSYGQADSIAYSYRSDRAFNTIFEVVDYPFCPSLMQTPVTSAHYLPGEVSVIIRKDSLVINGVEEVSSYAVNASYQYGSNYVFELIREDGSAGDKFVIIPDERGHVQYLFLNTETPFPVVFYLPEKSAVRKRADQYHVSDKKAYYIRSYVNMINKAIYPYQTNDYKVLTAEKRIEIGFLEEEIYFYTRGDSSKYEVKRATTYEYKSKDFPSVRSIIKVKLKKQKQRIKIYLNFRQEVECIEFGEKRYFLRT